MRNTFKYHMKLPEFNFDTHNGGAKPPRQRSASASCSIRPNLDFVYELLKTSKRSPADPQSVLPSLALGSGMKTTAWQMCLGAMCLGVMSLGAMLS